MKHQIEEPKDSFWTIFKDNNDWNEKSIIGFIAFIFMVGMVVVNMYSTWKGTPVVVEDYVFNAFTIIVVGSFGISGAENIMGKKRRRREYNQPYEEEPLPDPEDEG